LVVGSSGPLMFVLCFVVFVSFITM
jgi:hypothetical protein